MTGFFRHTDDLFRDLESIGFRERQNQSLELALKIEVSGLASLSAWQLQEASYSIIERPETFQLRSAYPWQISRESFTHRTLRNQMPALLEAV